MAGLRLKNFVTHARLVDHLTSEPNMGRKSFFHKKVLMSPTSWYKNTRAICFTVSVVLDLRARDTHARMGPLSTDGP